MERSSKTDNLLRRIPQNVLQVLQPYRHNIVEILRGQPDFSHLHYHILDCLFLLKYIDNTAEESRQETAIAVARGYPHIKRLDMNMLVYNLDEPSYYRVQKALEFHDTGKLFEKIGLKSEEHHFGSMFIAEIITGDPIVCQAVLYHVRNVLPKKSHIGRQTY